MSIYNEVNLNQDNNEFLIDAFKKKQLVDNIKRNK